MSARGNLVGRRTIQGSSEGRLMRAFEQFFRRASSRRAALAVELERKIAREGMDQADLTVPV